MMLYNQETKRKTVVGCRAYTCSKVDHGCCSCCDGIHLRVDFVFGFIHLVFAPSLGCLKLNGKMMMI